MKKPIIKLLFVPVAFFFISCHTGKTYELKLKLAEGDHFVQNTQMNMRSKYAVMGQSMNMNMGMDMGVAFDVLKSTADEKQLQMTYSKAKMTMDMGKMAAGINMDSIMNQASEKLVGKYITIVLSTDNQIKDVIGSEVIQNQSSDPRTNEMIKKMFSKEQINNLFGMMFNLYPDKPVAVGDSWEKENKVNMGEFEMKIKTKYTLTGVQNGSASVDVDGIINGKGNMVNNMMEMDMKGTQKGTMNLKIDNGRLLEGKYNMKLTAEMKAGGQMIPMDIDADYLMSGK